MPLNTCSFIHQAHLYITDLADTFWHLLKINNSNLPVCVVNSIKTRISTTGDMGCEMNCALPSISFYFFSNL